MREGDVRPDDGGEEELPPEPAPARVAPATARLALIFSVGALSLSLITSLMILLFVIQHDRELATRDAVTAQKLGRLEGQVGELRREIGQRSTIEAAVRAEVQTWQAYTVRLQTRMIEAGIRDVPAPPKPVGQ